MFSFGFSSVLGGRENPTKKTRRAANNDSWYLPYNGPYEAPPRDTTPQRRKQRDSWGDPIPSGLTTNNDLSAVGGILDKRRLHQQYEPRDIRYGVQGVFDDIWKPVGTSVNEPGRLCPTSERERGRRVSYGRDHRPSSGQSDTVKKPFSTTLRRRSTISGGNSPTVPDFMPLDGVSGGVGESPAPQRRPQKDGNRISLGSIFTFGARMRVGSPTRSIDEDRNEKADNADFKYHRPTSNPERALKPSISASPVIQAEKHFNNRQAESKKAIGYFALSNGREDYQDYYNSLYSSLVNDDNQTIENNPHLIHHKKARQRQHHPGSAAQDLPAEKAGQPTQSRHHSDSLQNFTVTSIGHPYAPYAHQGQDHYGLKDEKLPSPVSDDSTRVYHQRHPYNQTQPTFSRYPYGHSSVSTGTSSPSQLAATRGRGSGQSESHSEGQQPVLHTNTSAVASGIGGGGLGAGMDSKQLKISRSTPNFHRTQPDHDPSSVAGPSNAFQQTRSQIPSSSARQLPPLKLKDRWLSAETWCDALLFPRPRLKVKQDKAAALYSQGDESFIGGPAPSASGRIVSPPPSPLVGEWDIGIHDKEESGLRDQRGEARGEGGASQKQKEAGIPSRVLAHSRSFDVRMRSGKEPIGYTSDIEPRAARRGKDKMAPVIRDKDVRDVLSLPSPVPDLSEVLSEGRLLDEERQAWKDLAVNSFGNKRSRSLSRTRTKSLTRKGKSSMRRKERSTESDEKAEEEEHGQSSFEYLAAQACLGNQAASPNCSFLPNGDATNVPAAHSSVLSTGVGNGIQSGHPNSHSTSPKALITKSSKSQPKTHLRNNSVGNSGRLAVSKICGNVGLDVDVDVDQRVNLLSNVGVVPRGSTGPDLECALKGHGTKVIRLADPAHIPVDKGPPVSQTASPIPITHSQRKTPSPNLSVSNLSDISHSKVGIAIGTPPEEAEGTPTVFPAGPLPLSASYVPSHPYAKGGLSFSVQSSSTRREDATDRGPSPKAHSDTKVPPISEILSRPEVSPHPYALASGSRTRDQSIQPAFRFGMNVVRDSYLDANGLIGQFRTDHRQPDPSRMWAQLSPNVVREILPDDLQYSPYDSDVKGIEKLEGNRYRDEPRMRSIHDTAGVAEALLNATGYRQDQKSQEPDGTLTRALENMKPKQNTLLNDNRKASHTSSAHTIASSHLDPQITPISHPEALDHGETASSAATSDSPSPAFRLLGTSPNDLDNYQDLFYQPNTTNDHPHASPDDGMTPEDRTNISWDRAVRNRRTGSSLTSLARQLGEEYEALASANPSRGSSIYFPSRSRSLGAQPHYSGTSRLSSDGNLQFVLEEMASAESPDRMSNVHESVQAFESANLPEDVYSLQTSSIMDGNGEEDDPTGVLRLGTVESLATPVAVDVEHRSSFNGETIYDYENQNAISTESIATPQADFPNHHHPQETERPIIRRELLTVGLPLQRPLTQVTRSSCMSTSDLSGLSDFPAPPKSLHSEQHELGMPTPTPQHVAVFDSYFEGERKDDDLSKPDGSFSESEAESQNRGLAFKSYDKVIPQVEFGVNQSASELAKSLSSPSL